MKYQFFWYLGNLAKELFNRDEFSDRPKSYHDSYIRGMEGETLGIAATTGMFWQEQRRFTLKHLKDLGFGRNKLDAIVQEEVHCGSTNCVGSVEKAVGGTVDNCFNSTRSGMFPPK